jgi:hypothetical protein
MELGAGAIVPQKIKIIFISVLDFKLKINLDTL